MIEPVAVCATCGEEDPVETGYVSSRKFMVAEVETHEVPMSDGVAFVVDRVVAWHHPCCVRLELSSAPFMPNYE